MEWLISEFFDFVSNYQKLAEWDRNAPVDLSFHHLSLFIAIYQTFERGRYAADKKGLDVDKSSGIIVTYGHSIPRIIATEVAS